MMKCIENKLCTVHRVSRFRNVHNSHLCILSYHNFRHIIHIFTSCFRRFSQDSPNKVLRSHYLFLGMFFSHFNHICLKRKCFVQSNMWSLHLQIGHGKENSKHNKNEKNELLIVQFYRNDEMHTGQIMYIGCPGSAMSTTATGVYYHIIISDISYISLHHVKEIQSGFIK